MLLGTREVIMVASKEVLSHGGNYSKIVVVVAYS